jgi:hypothetical protein
MTINSSTCNFAMIKNTTDKIKQIKGEIQTLQERSTSDVKEQHCYDMNPSLADQNIYVEDLLRQCDVRNKNYAWMANLLNMQESAIQNLNDTIESAKVVCIRAFDQYGDISMDMELNSKNLLTDIETVLSNTFFGINIWNGSHTNELPFAKDSIVNGEAGSNFYLGDDFGLKLHINGTESEFGDRGNYECFQKLIGALQQMRDIKDPTTQDSKAILEKASALLDEAQIGFYALIQKVGNAQLKCKKAMDDNDTALVNFSNLYSDSLNGMGDIDRALSVISITEVQNKLSYMFKTTVALINEMDIFKYI